MEINEQNKKIIIQDSQNSYPNECCGILANINNQIIAIPCKNISESPLKSFIIDPAQIHLYDINKIEGFYHSHKDIIDFSIADIAFSEKLKKYCILYVVDSNIFKFYQPNGMEIPYIGRPFFLGTLDCSNLVKDYYRRELNIKLDDIQHPERFNLENWKNEKLWNDYKAWNILEEYLLSQGFIKVNELKKFDIITMKMLNIRFPIHLAVYMGEDRILHHLNEFSEISNYSNSYKRLTYGIYRHHTLT